MTTFRETYDRAREIVAIAIFFALLSLAAIVAAVFIFGYSNGILL